MIPILFNTDMVEAILLDKKTQTRRLDKSIPDGTSKVIRFEDDCGKIHFHLISSDGYCLDTVTPKWQRGDVLWVRETHCILPVDSKGRLSSEGDKVYYRADGEIRPVGWRGSWTPSIHMKKEYARLFLEVVDIKLERINSIDEVSAMQEGATPHIKIKTMVGDLYSPDTKYGKFVQGFAKIWDSTLSKSDKILYNFDTNPWVWVISFKRVPKPEDFSI